MNNDSIINNSDNNNDSNNDRSVKNEYQKNYYKNNRDKLLEHKRRMKEEYYKYIDCDICGKKYQKHHKTIHNKTKFHIIANLTKQLNDKKQLIQ